MNMESIFSLGIIGARGFVGAELMALIAHHPRIELAFVSSRELAGQFVGEHHAIDSGALRYESLDPQAAAAKGADIVVLALPNGKAAPYVAALDARRPDTLILDLSADYRFDPGWYYGLPELTRARYAGQTHISNPGCYATAMQLAIAPMQEYLDGPVSCFGVSGWSGAGTTPSDKNDTDLLRDNLMPYALTNHLHEREVTTRLGCRVEFMPHVAAHFRGITLTANLHLNIAFAHEDVMALYQKYYTDEPLIEICLDAPWVSRIAGQHGVQIGGFTLSPDNKRMVVVVTLDNLLKGAATQALQNINCALGVDELTAILSVDGRTL